MHDGIQLVNSTPSVTFGGKGDRHHCASGRPFVWWKVPRASLLISRWAEPMNEREGGTMSLNTLALGGLILAAVLIVVSISLIHRFAA